MSEGSTEKSADPALARLSWYSVGALFRRCLSMLSHKTRFRPTYVFYYLDWHDLVESVCRMRPEIKADAACREPLELS